MKSGWSMSLMTAVVTAVAAGEGMAKPFDCIVEPRQTVEIRSAAAGVLQDVKVRRGEMVRSGQPLVEIDAAVERASLAVAAFRATMLAPERLAAERLKFAKAKAARLQNLSEDKFVSVQERDAAIAEEGIAEAQLLESRENRRLAVLEQRRLEEQVRLKTLRAPMDANVVDRTMHPGELVNGDEGGKAILRLADLTTLHVELLLPSTAWNRVKLGQSADVQLELPGVSARAASVIAIDRVMDAASGTFGVRLALPNPRLELPAGVRCKVVIPGL